MTAYHAIHESPYDDACPDCTGMEWTEDEGREWSRYVALLAVALMVAAVLFAGVRR